MDFFVRIVGVLLLCIVGYGLSLFLRLGMHEQLHMFFPPSIDVEHPAISDEIQPPALLIFSKTSGWRHYDSIDAANSALQNVADRLGWPYEVTENSAIFHNENLNRFSVVVWNNNTGRLLTCEQRLTLRAFIENGGGFIALHGAGDSSHNSWPWFKEHVIRARFAGHPFRRQVQSAKVIMADRSHPITSHMNASWQHSDEWYGFSVNPREKDVTVLASLDETSYDPEHTAMGDDHPIMWTHAVENGRVFYSALGHTAATYANTDYVKLLEKAILWVQPRPADENLSVESENDISRANGASANTRTQNENVIVISLDNMGVSFGADMLTPEQKSMLQQEAFKELCRKESGYPQYVDPTLFGKLKTLLQ